MFEILIERHGPDFDHPEWGHTYGLGFSDERTAAALLDAVRQHGFDLAIWLGLSPNDDMQHCGAGDGRGTGPDKLSPALILGGKWWVRFSNRDIDNIVKYPLPHPSTRDKALWAPVVIRGQDHG